MQRLLDLSSIGFNYPLNSEFSFIGSDDGDELDDQPLALDTRLELHEHFLDLQNSSNKKLSVDNEEVGLSQTNLTQTTMNNLVLFFLFLHLHIWLQIVLSLKYQLTNVITNLPIIFSQN